MYELYLRPIYLIILNYMKTIIGMILIVLGICSCSTFSSKIYSEQQNAITTKSKEAKKFEKLFRKAADKRVYFNKIIKEDIVKNRIISQYSQKFYEILSLYAERITPVEYYNGIYHCEGFNRDNAFLDSDMYLKYNPSNDKLTITIDFYGLGNDIVKPDGEINLNTEGWEFKVIDVNDEYGEHTKKLVTGIHSFTYDNFPFGGKYKYEYVIQIFATTTMIWTNKFGDSNIRDIRIQDINKKMVYNIELEKEIYKNNDNSTTDVGGYLSKATTTDLATFIKRTPKYSISLRDLSNENVIIKQNKAIDNFFNAYYKICYMQDLINLKNEQER